MVEELFNITLGEVGGKSEAKDEKNQDQAQLARSLHRHFHVLQFSVTVKQQVNSFSLQKEPVGAGRVLGLHDLRRPIAQGIGNAKSDRVGLIIVVPTSQSLIAEANFFR